MNTEPRSFLSSLLSVLTVVGLMAALWVAVNHYGVAARNTALVIPCADCPRQ